MATQLHTIYIDDSGEKEYGENTSRFYAVVERNGPERPEARRRIATENLRKKIGPTPADRVPVRWCD